MNMRLIHVYLVIYFALIAGASAALISAGALSHLSGLWLLGALAVAICLGILLGISYRRPTET
jgi:hypothetical protein